MVLIKQIHNLKSTHLTNFKNSQIYFIISLLSLLFIFYFFYFPFFLSRAKFDDLVAYIIAAKNYLAGQNIYQKHLDNYLIIDKIPKNFIYLPLIVYGFIPLLKFDFYLVAFLWIISQHFFIIASIYLSLKLFYKKVDYIVFLLTFTVSIFSFPVLMNFTLGQIGPLLLFLLTLSLYLFVKDKDFWGSIFLSTAAYLKLFPLAIGILFVKGKKINILYLTVTFLILILSSYVLMKNELQIFLFSVFPSLIKGNASPANQSISAFFMRLFIMNPFTYNLITDKTIFSILSMVSIFIIFLVFIINLSRSKNLINNYFLVLSTILIVSSFNWVHYYILFLPSFLYVFSPLNKLSKTLIMLNILALLFIFFPIPYLAFTKNGLFILLLSFPLYGLLIHWMSLIKISSIKN